MEIIAKFYPHIWSQKLIDQIVITSEVVIKEEIKGVGEAEFVMPIAPEIKEECKVELYEVNSNEDRLLFRGFVHEINPVWGQFQSLKIIARGEKAIFHKRKTLRKHTFTAQALSSILQKLLEPYNTEFNEDWGFEIQKEETLTLEIAQGDDYYDIFDEICEQKELFWTVVDGTVHFKKHGEDLRATQILEYDGLSPNPWNITNIELIGTASGGNVVLVEDSKWNLTIDKSQYSWLLTGVVSKQIRKGDDNEKAKQFAKEQARPQRKYKIQVANWSIIANLWDRIKVEVVNTNSFYDYSGEAIVQSKTTSYSNASKVVVYGIQEFLVSPFAAENRVENVEKSIKLLRQRKGGGETPAPQVDLSWYATSSAVNQAIQSQNTKIEKKADSSFVQWVAQTAQTALNAANQAKQTADSKANDSDVVHKSWNETIDWWKTFSGWLALRDNKIYLRSHWDNNHYIKFDPWAWNWWDWVRIHEIGGFTFSTIDGDVFKLTAQGNLKFGKTEADIEVKDLTLWKHNPKETQTISQYAKATNWTPWGINFIDYVAATPNWLTNWGKELRWYLRIGDATRTFDRFQVRGYEWFDGTEASLPNAKKYIKLEAPKILLWDDDILWDWKTYTPTVSANWSPTITESFWKYQKIWKTVHCKVKLRVRRNWSYWRFFVSLPVNARDTWEIVDGTSIVWTFWASNSNNYGYITVSNWHAQILWGIWHAGNFGNLSEDVFISFSITYEAI